MRHLCRNKKLGRPTDQRLALLRALVSALFMYGAIETTDTRAKEAKRLAERIICYGKKADLHSRRLALQLLPQKKIIADVFNRIAKQYDTRDGGCTRVIKLGFRQGDGATISRLELIG